VACTTTPYNTSDDRPGGKVHADIATGCHNRGEAVMDRRRRDERQPGQPRHPKGPTGDAAQYLGMLRGLVEQMTTALHGGELHVDVQKGYFAVYQRSVPAMLAALAERSQYDAAFTRQGVEQVPLASIQLLTAATALQAAGDALAGASVVASGGPGGARLTEKDAAVVQKRTEQAWHTSDLLHEYVEGKRKSWAAEDAPQ
jgi:hypothetical protein